MFDKFFITRLASLKSHLAYLATEALSDSIEFVGAIQINLSIGRYLTLYVGTRFHVPYRRAGCAPLLHRESKKQDNILLSVTLPNVSQFSKLLHR